MGPFFSSSQYQSIIPGDVEKRLSSFAKRNILHKFTKITTSLTPTQLQFAKIVFSADNFSTFSGSPSRDNFQCAPICK